MLKQRKEHILAAIRPFKAFLSSLLVRDTDESTVPGNGLEPALVCQRPCCNPLAVRCLAADRLKYTWIYAIRLGICWRRKPVLEGLGATDFAVELATRASGGMLEKLDQLAPLPNTEAER